MATRVFGSGTVGAALTSDLFAAPPVLTQRGVFFLNNSNARASDSHAGTEYEEPMLTWAAVYALASANDIIVVGAGHIEAINQVVAKAGLTVMGLGSGTGLPIFKLSSTVNGYVFDLNAAGIELRNLQLQDNSPLTGDPDWSAGILRVRGAACHIYNVDVQGRAGGVMQSTAPLVTITAGGARSRFDYCKVRNLGTTETANSAGYVLYGVLIEGAATNLGFTNSTFDGGTAGFDAGAVHVAGALTVTGFYEYNNVWKNGADIKVTAGSTFRGYGGGSTWGTAGGIGRIEVTGPIRWWGRVVAASEGGHDVLSSESFWSTGAIYWVNSAGANASDSNPGTRRAYPFATVGAATAAMTGSAGDLAILEATHAETKIAPYSMSAKPDIKYFGLGYGTARATFSFNPSSSGSTSFWQMDGVGAQLRNVRFNAVLAGHASFARLVYVTVAACVIESCDFTVGEFCKVTVEASTAGVDAEYSGNTFTLTKTGPTVALLLGHGAPNYTRVLANIFDGGNIEWTTAALGNGGVSSEAYVQGNTFRQRGNAVASTATLWHIADNVQDAGCRVAIA